jgi:isochorismate hydrolase
MDSKTPYFSIENIEQASLDMLDQFAGQRDRRISTYNPIKSALLVLDMQAYFLEPSSHAYIPSAPAIIPRIKSLAQSYYSKNLPVIFTQHLNTLQDAGSMANWWSDLIRIENPQSGIILDFDFSNRYVLRKSQYDAFYQTTLDNMLHKKGVSQIVITGVMTHLCCETTARSAFVRGFEVFFIVDGTATYNEDHHMATLRNLSHGFATPMLAKEIQEILLQQVEN